MPRFRLGILSLFSVFFTLLLLPGTFCDSAFVVDSFGASSAVDFAAGHAEKISNEPKYADVTIELEAAQKRIRDLESALQSERLQSWQLKRDHEQCQADVETHRQQAIAATTALVSTTKDVTDRTLKLEGLDEKLVDCHKDMRALQEAEGNVRSMMNTCHLSLKEADTTLTRSRSDNDRCRSDIERQITEIISLKRQVERAQKERMGALRECRLNGLALPQFSDKGEVMRQPEIITAASLRHARYTKLQGMCQPIQVITDCTSLTSTWLGDAFSEIGEHVGLLVNETIGVYVEVQPQVQTLTQSTVEIAQVVSNRVSKLIHPVKEIISERFFIVYDNHISPFVMTHVEPRMRPVIGVYTHTILPPLTQFKGTLTTHLAPATIETRKLLGGGRTAAGEAMSWMMRRMMTARIVLTEQRQAAAMFVLRAPRLCQMVGIDFDASSLSVEDETEAGMGLVGGLPGVPPPLLLQQALQVVDYALIGSIMMSVGYSWQVYKSILLFLLKLVVRIVLMPIIIPVRTYQLLFKKKKTTSSSSSKAKSKSSNSSTKSSAGIAAEGGGGYRVKRSSRSSVSSSSSPIVPTGDRKSSPRASDALASAPSARAAGDESMDGTAEATDPSSNSSSSSTSGSSSSRKEKGVSKKSSKAIVQ